MNQKSSESISYTHDLIGGIRSHLAGLQGYDVMALELIQNADDSKANVISFDITDHGLVVYNSGKFTYCGDLRSRTCKFMDSSDYSCDFHRIVKVASGGKLSRSDNIGRFGIGFVSTYQVTDRPEIRSAGIKLTLHPEREESFIEAFEQQEGTTFFLPWARDPNTEARRALGISHVSPTHVDQLAEDFQKVLRKSLLFLRHVRFAEVKRNGKLLLSCDLERGDGSDLVMRFRPVEEVEQWHILRADVADSARALYAAHSRLESLGRSTKISIGLRIEPESLNEGLLYAFLPTEQLTGLPAHINADFFPESDRKAVIFAGYQHEQAWNEMLIEAAATELARDLEELLKIIGPQQLWLIIDQAFTLSKSPGYPSCYKRFWEQLKLTGAQAQIALGHDGSVQNPCGVLLPRSPISVEQASALLELGGKLVADHLRPFQNALTQLGTPFLTLDRFTSLLLKSMMKLKSGEDLVHVDRLESFYIPLWSLVNDLLPESSNQTSANKLAIQQLLSIPFIVTEDLYAVAISQSYVTPHTLDAQHVASLLPSLAVSTHHISKFQRIATLINELDLVSAANHIRYMCTTAPIEEVIGVEKQQLHDLYELLSELDRQGDSDKTVYKVLCDLPIWLSSQGLIKATEALLPGDFIDPLGQSELLDTSGLSISIIDFLKTKLEIKEQTIETFVQIVLPNFFNDNGPSDTSKYYALISELANHPKLINNENIRKQLGSLPLVPTEDGGWTRATNAYRRTDELVRVLGDSKHLWLDESRVPNVRSIHAFINSLGIRKSPMAQHLVERMILIAENFQPTDDAKRDSREAFYALCDRYEDWKDMSFFPIAINSLLSVACFPAQDDTDHWHFSSNLFAPYRAESFRSQAKILDFKSAVRLKKELLEVLNITINPDTQMVIDHLRHCVQVGTPAHISTYQVLNECAQREDPLISTLAGDPFLYVESLNCFVRPNQLYWTPQKLGRFAFSIPSSLDSFKPLFKAIGVKNDPEMQDYADILLDIIGDYFQQAKSVEGTDRSVYDACLLGMAQLEEREEAGTLDLKKLQEAPTILNLNGKPTYPDEVFLQDSEWYAGFFNGELDDALCKPIPEIWSFIEKFGVRRLSESAKVELEIADGLKTDETQLAEKLMVRIEILERFLHDKPAAIRLMVRKCLSQVTAVSYELVRIKASVNIGGDWISAPPKTTHAFYNRANSQLILSRPLSDRSWPHILNSIFHQLMPEELGNEILKLTGLAGPRMLMTVKEAHQDLSDYGFPQLEVDDIVQNIDGLESSDLGEMGNSWVESFHDESKSDSAPSDVQKNVEYTSINERMNAHLLEDKLDSMAANMTKVTGPFTDQSFTNKPWEETKAQSAVEPPPVHGQHAVSANHLQKDAERPGISTLGIGNSPVASAADKLIKQTRPKYKQQRDQHRLSYVRKMMEESIFGNVREDSSEHNLAVEAVARAAVSDFEKARGRVAEQMAQTNPGYDIISRNPLTGEERFIEVKGISGEWNKAGVGLSSTQFHNAQNLGDRYWLYVVEFVADPKHICVHPICGPATQVMSFMFDGNWRYAAENEQNNPLLAYTKGIKILHKSFGEGIVTEVIKDTSSMRVILIKYISGETRPLTLNAMDLPKILSDLDDDLS